RLQAGALRFIQNAPAVWRDRLRSPKFRDRTLFALRLYGWKLRTLDADGDPFADNGSVGSVLAPVVKPWVTASGRQSEEILAQALAPFEHGRPICGEDLVGMKTRARENYSWWNKMGSAFTDLMLNPIARAGRLEVDFELTAKVLELKAAREANGGRWPESLDGLTS